MFVTLQVSEKCEVKSSQVAKTAKCLVKLFPDRGWNLVRYNTKSDSSSSISRVTIIL